MAIVRVLVGLAIAIGMTGVWMLLACAVMGISLCLARLVPLAGKHRRQG